MSRLKIISIRSEPIMEIMECDTISLLWYWSYKYLLFFVPQCTTARNMNERCLGFIRPFVIENYNLFSFSTLYVLGIVVGCKRKY